jgi:hypothetical protein
LLLKAAVKAAEINGAKLSIYDISEIPFYNADIDIERFISSRATKSVYERVCFLGTNHKKCIAKRSSRDALVRDA